MTSPGTAGLPALPGDRIADRHRLPARVVGYWRIKALLSGVVILGVGSLGAWQLRWFTPEIRWAAVTVAAIAVLASILIAPPIRYRIFWYAVGPDEIDLEHGLLVRVRTVVPMNRVQHLKTEHGPLADRFRLASLHIHTAAGTVSLPSLDSGDAALVRNRIADLAHLADDV